MIAFRAGGSRSRVEEAEATEIRDRFERERDAAGEQPCFELDLSCRSWPAASLRVLEDFMRSIAPSVAVLKVDDIIASLNTEDGLETLGFLVEVFCANDNGNNCVEYLNLNDNALGTRGVEVLRPLLEGPRLKTLLLHNCGLSKEVSQTLHDILRVAAVRFHELDLSRNQIAAEGAEHVGNLISVCTSLKSFTYAGSRPMAEGTVSLCRGLAAACDLGSRLTRLNLHDCLLTEPQAMEDLCRVLTMCTDMRRLVLLDCEIGPEGIVSVLDALKKAESPLCHLDLGGNEIGEDGAGALATYLQEVSTGTSNPLEELRLEVNELGNEGVISIVQALAAGNFAHLRVLNLENNEIGASGARSLTSLEKITSLEEINLTDNMDISEKAATELQKLFGDEKVLVDEDLEGDEEEDGEVDQADAELGAALEATHLDG